MKQTIPFRGYGLSASALGGQQPAHDNEVSMPKEIKFPIPKTYLMVDAMYYHAACESYERAIKLTKAIKTAEQKVWLLQRRWDNVEEKYGDDAAALYTRQERLAIQLESADYNVGVAYGPHLQALAVTHVMSVAALESHINARGKEFLNGKTLEHFERIALEAKWLFLPRMLGAKGFAPGAQPYQGFAQLISIRNELVHYKEREEDWQISGSAVPSFLGKLGLTMKAAGQSLESVRGMIGDLAEQLEQEIPYWLRVKKTSYFGFRIR
jgi:hypothetical protein